MPSWISKKGNLCWKIKETLYVKLKNGYTIMLKGKDWMPVDTSTKAKAPTQRPEEPEDYKLMQFPDTL